MANGRWLRIGSFGCRSANHVREGTKAIELQLEEPIGMVEGGGDADEGHGRDGHSASQIKGDECAFFRVDVSQRSG